MERKPRADSKLDSLPGGKFLELRDALLRGEWTYEDALSWLQTECGVTSTLSSLSAFFRRHCAPVLRDRRKLAAVKAEVLAEEAGKTDWTEASLELVKQMTFEMLSNPTFDPETVEKFLKLVIKSRDQDMDMRKVAILEAKAKQADKAKDVMNQKLSPEEQARRIREILK